MGAELRTGKIKQGEKIIILKVKDKVVFNVMNKKLGLLVLFFGVTFAKAQNIYVCKNAQLSFFSSAPIEDIEAVTSRGVSAMNIKTGDIFVKVGIQSFQFKKSLMQEHFNEDYLESDKYPFAEFKGRVVTDPDFSKEGIYPVTVAGTLTIHNVPKDYSVPGIITVKNGQMTATADFKVRLADHNIKIPRLLTKNIAEVVDVKVSAVYSKDNEVK